MFAIASLLTGRGISELVKTVYRMNKVNKYYNELWLIIYNQSLPYMGINQSVITFLLVNYIMSLLIKRVTEIMSEGPVDVVEKGLNVFYAANVMRERARGSLVVVDDGKPVGIVTERDIVRRVVAEGRSPSATKVGDIMSTPLISVGPEATVAAAVRIMYENGIRRLPVVENDRIVVMLTVTDLARAMYREREKKDEILAAMARFRELEELAKR